MHKKIEIFMVACLFVSSFFLARATAALVSSQQTTTQKPCIVLDAGHGGADPGKVGPNNLLEKDLNLKIVYKLKTLFENKGFEVILTRTDDKALVSPDSKSVKVEDLKNRVALIEKCNPLLTVSIHQNSYPDSSVSGPQVFYFHQSAESQVAAAAIQEAIIQQVNPPKQRVSKSNNDYYILKKTPTPTVIVECGFLSNETEAANLATDAYQDKLARAIYSGVCNYLEQANQITIIKAPSDTTDSSATESSQEEASDIQTSETKNSDT